MRGCGNPISKRYPFVELLTGVMFGAVAWKLGFGWPALCGLVLTSFLVALAFIDIDTQLLPDALTFPLIWLGVVAALILGPASPTEAAGQPIPVDLRSSVIGAVAGYMSLWLIYHLFRLLTGKEGMGYGDFKLLAAIGAWLGWKMLLPTILFSAAVGAVSGIRILLDAEERALHPDLVRPIPRGGRLADADVGPRGRGRLPGALRPPAMNPGARKRSTRRRLLRVGLTGGIASGKTTVSRLFEALGVPVIDTDVLAREVVAPGQPLLVQISERFGKQVIAADGSLDRAALRAIVFADPAARTDLEQLTHPAIRALLEERSAALRGTYQDPRDPTTRRDGGPHAGGSRSGRGLQ